MMTDPAEDLVFQSHDFEPSFAWRNQGDIRLGRGFQGRVARRFAAHRFSLPVVQMTARGVVLDPVTAMVFRDETPLPWSCFFGPYDVRVPGDCAAAAQRARAGRRVIAGRRVYCGFNRHFRNYAHWITQCVPAIASYAEEPGFADGILLLPELTSNSERALTLAGIDLPEVVRVDAASVLALDELVYSTLLLHHYAPSRFCRTVFDRMIAAAYPDRRTEAPGPSDQIQADRIPGDRIPDGRIQAHSIPGDRIYVWRPDSPSRPMTNEDELLARLVAEGVEPVLPGAMSIDDQIRRFQAARLVIGPHGAGLGNIVFCRPGAIMYELIPEHWIDSFVGPSINLFAQLSGMHYWADAHVSHGTFAQFGHQVPWSADLAMILARLGEIEAAYA